jgi:hypothetical protein
MGKLEEAKKYYSLILKKLDERVCTILIFLTVV